MSTQAEPPSREGELLAQKYRLEKRLGTGGQGEVYRARNELIGREVAIKLLRGEWAQDPTTVTRFIREARAANMVRHTNVVDVLDIGKDDSGTPFIVQELLAGQTLDDYLDTRGGRLLPPEVYDLVIPICEAVGAAHARGVIHRDLKPGNIFLAKSGATFVPKVLDFGLAKVSEAHGVTDVTTTGAWFGTPAYMPPEQIRHTRTVDARSDVWALGVLLYEMLAGRRPFDSHTVGDLFVVICTEDPIALREYAPHVSESLARVVHRCIVRDADRRYANADELAKDLLSSRSGGALLEVTADRQRKPANDVVTAQPGRTDRPMPVDASEATEDTRIRGEPLESQKTKPVTPRGGEQPITPVKQATDVAKSPTLQAVPLDSEPAPLEAKRSPPSASGELVAARPSSTAPAEISTSSSRAAEARSRSRTWTIAVSASVAVVAIAGVIGLRSHGASATAAANAPPTTNAATNPSPRIAPVTAPPAHVEASPAPAPNTTPPAPATEPTAPPAAIAQTTASDPHGSSHHTHHASTATAHAATPTAGNAGATATTQPSATPPAAIRAATQPAAGALPTHEMHGATRYEP